MAEVKNLHIADPLAWLETLTCPVIRLEEDESAEQLINRVISV